PPCRCPTPRSAGSASRCAATCPVRSIPRQGVRSTRAAPRRSRAARARCRRCARCGRATCPPVTWHRTEESENAMRIEYTFGLEDVEVPYFSVESMEGPEKLFRLATLVLNVLAVKRRVDVIFHSPNQSDLPKKIQAFETILGSAPQAPAVEFMPGRE